MSFFKSESVVCEPRANELFLAFVARAGSLPKKTEDYPQAEEALGEYLVRLRTRTKLSVQDVATKLGNTFPGLSLNAARLARLESGDTNALSEDGIRVLAAYYGGAPKEAVELGELSATTTNWATMNARAQNDLETLSPEDRQSLEDVLANIVDQLRQEDSKF